jgi:putative protease
VAYSGQCLTSESLGGRSANRGQCAQACRLPYELVCDGQDVDLGDVKYLLSPQDLAAYALVPELIDAGVSCFKIEGRLKTPEYVANITRQYRRALDAVAAGQEARFTDEDVTEMELSFSRGFSPGWLGGCDHKMLVPGLSSAKRGVLLGKVKAIRGQRVIVSTLRSVAPGDGIVFAGNREEDAEQGGRIYSATPRTGDQIELTFAKGAVDFSRLKAGQQLWKTDDPKLSARLRKSFTSTKPRRRVALELFVHAAVGQPLRISGRATNGATCELQSDAPLQAANKHPLTHALLEQQLGRLGGSVYELRHLHAEIIGQPIVPLSVLGKLRHNMIAQLASSKRVPTRRILPSPHVEMASECRGLSPFAPGTIAAMVAEQKGTVPLSVRGTAQQPTLRVLCRTLEQLDAAARCGIHNLFVDFQDIRDYRLAVEAANRHGATVYLAAPRIQKPGETGIFRAMAKHGAHGFLVRNLAGLAYCAEHEIPFACDFSLNAANQWTVEYLRSRGAERVTASYDLNRDQLLDLVNAVPSGWLEVVIHQHMPMFHMEHCVFCAVLSPGTNKTNCGRPCDVHAVKLRDRVGMEHVLQADVGCRNTLYNAVPQSAAEVVPMLLSKGLRDFRIELLSETDSEACAVIGLYQELLGGQIGGKQVWQRLRAANRVGVTRGTLEERRNPLAIL